MTRKERLAALENLLAILDRRWKDRYATPQEVLVAMNAVDGGTRGDQDR